MAEDGNEMVLSRERRNEKEVAAKVEGFFLLC